MKKPVSMVSICNEACTVSNTGNQNDWWTDNDATKHITNNPEWCIDFKEFNRSRSIIAAEKEPLQAIGSDSIKVLSIVDIQKRRYCSF